MTTVIAKHTIHRASKTKGQQDVLPPGSRFECSGKELDDFVALGAVTVVEDAPGKADKPAARKPRAKAKSESEPTPDAEPDADLDDGLDF